MQKHGDIRYQIAVANAYAELESHGLVYSLITSGSQQALNLVAQVLLHPRDVVLVASPI